MYEIGTGSVVFLTRLSTSSAVFHLIFTHTSRDTYLVIPVPETWLLVMHCKSGSSLAFSEASLGFSFLKCAELLPLSCFLKCPNFIVLFSSLMLFVLLVSPFLPSFLLSSLPSSFFPFLPLFTMFYTGSQKEAEVNMFNEHV